jgi:5,10-methylene-tetrahydrofolate dehydrogenase/methenyl tetrahydrofolate cyclohydrolase
MANPISHFPETEDDIIITCPRCDSNRVLVNLNSNNFYEVKDIVKAISPVPGGVGQMTVLALFENLIDLSTFNKK